LAKEGRVGHVEWSGPKKSKRGLTSILCYMDGYINVGLDREVTVKRSPKIGKHFVVFPLSERASESMGACRALGAVFPRVRSRNCPSGKRLRLGAGAEIV